LANVAVLPGWTVTVPLLVELLVTVRFPPFVALAVPVAALLKFDWLKVRVLPLEFALISPLLVTALAPFSS